MDDLAHRIMQQVILKPYWGKEWYTSFLCNFQEDNEMPLPWSYSMLLQIVCGKIEKMTFEDKVSQYVEH